ncbi:hypothetical protein [Noviherbaspirillum sp. ST9]|uniref:hypothetical protein n=1 Tax=Noviherbaspirillum sp. ST9 TaxID=3401606 RepID=UPI003B589E9E
MTESEIQHADGEGLARRISRRVFLRNASMTAVAIVATACGGGGSTGPATAEATEAAASTSALGARQNPTAPVVDNPPLWSEIPTITFTQGVASTFSIAGFVSDDDATALTILKNELALPPGVTYDPATKSFVYDGLGAVGATSGHVLTATEA